MATDGKQMGEAALGGNRRLSLLVDNEKILGFLMIAPAVAYVLALVGYPLVLAFIYSLSDITVGSSHFSFVGLKNIKYIIQDPEFQTAVKNTLLFTFISQLIVVVLAQILALLLVKDFKGKFFVRALILMPYVAPISLGVIGWLWMLDSIYSPINWLLQHTGLFGPNFWPMWLGKPDLAMSAIITVHVWRMLPLATVIILAGLSSIPHDIQDAALVDGAGYFRQLFQITIPMMLPIIIVAVLFGIVFTATDIIIILVLTREDLTIRHRFWSARPSIRVSMRATWPRERLSLSFCSHFSWPLRYLCCG